MAEDKYGQITVNPSAEFRVNKKLHRREHVLADDLSRQMSEPKRFAAYLGLAMRFPENVLRRIASEVKDSYDRDRGGKIHPGKLFFYKVGEYAKNSPKPKSNFKKKSAANTPGRNRINPV